MAKQIIIGHVFNVYGDQPEAALELVHEGASKQDIRARTACTIGVFDASFTIEAGEVFVIMGLSGSGKSTLVGMLNRMVVIASMIAVGGLGQMVLRGIGRLDMGLATVGGIGIVVLAITLDRLTPGDGTTAPRRAPLVPDRPGRFHPAPGAGRCGRRQHGRAAFARRRPFTQEQGSR